jgi:hypothetical protein
MLKHGPLQRETEAKSAMDAKFLSCFEGRTRQHRIRNIIFREVGILNLLTELEDKLLYFAM